MTFVWNKGQICHQVNINPARGLHLVETGGLNKIINNNSIHVVVEKTTGLLGPDTSASVRGCEGFRVNRAAPSIIISVNTCDKLQRSLYTHTHTHTHTHKGFFSLCTSKTANRKPHDTQALIAALRFIDHRNKHTTIVHSISRVVAQVGTQPSSVAMKVRSA